MMTRHKPSLRSLIAKLLMSNFLSMPRVGVLIWWATKFPRALSLVTIFAAPKSFNLSTTVVGLRRKGGSF